MNNRFYSMLGLCMKAGKVKSGAFSVTDAVHNGKAWVVITATDASANTKKEFMNMCSFYEVPYYEYGTKDELGHAMGKEERSCIAVCDEGFSKSILKLIDTNAGGKVSE